MEGDYYTFASSNAVEFNVHVKMLIVIPPLRIALC